MKRGPERARCAQDLLKRRGGNGGRGGGRGIGNVVRGIRKTRVRVKTGGRDVSGVGETRFGVEAVVGGRDAALGAEGVAGRGGGGGSLRLLIKGRTIPGHMSFLTAAKTFPFFAQLLA